MVGIVAPGSPPFEEGDLDFSFQWLKKLGLRWKLGKHPCDERGENIMDYGINLVMGVAQS